MPKDLLSLPLLPSPADEAAAPAPDWHGFTAVGPVAESAAAAPEPDAPQGEYSAAPADAPSALPVPEVVADASGGTAGPRRRAGRRLRRLPLRRRRHLPRPEEILRPRRGRELHPRRTAPRSPPTPTASRRAAASSSPSTRSSARMNWPNWSRRVAALADIGVDAAHHPGPRRLSRRPQALPGAGTARQHAAGRPQPGGGGGAGTARLHARRAGPRADLRGSPRHHGHRRASRRRCSSTGRCATPTAACACSRRRRSAAAATAASAPIPAAIPTR